MEPTLNHRKIIEEYFRIWKAYDIIGVMQLFDAKARYEIIPKQRTLIGHAEICEYWKRNAQRQLGLELSWIILSIKKSHAKAYFIAEFYDKKENEHQKVVGTIDFYFNNDNSIILLSESYQKSSRWWK